MQLIDVQPACLSGASKELLVGEFKGCVLCFDVLVCVVMTCILASYFDFKMFH